jgi:hypothetical protein
MGNTGQRVLLSVQPVWWGPARPERLPADGLRFSADQWHHGATCMAMGSITWQNERECCAAPAAVLLLCQLQRTPHLHAHTR